MRGNSSFRSTILAGLALAPLTGCGGIALSPVVNEPRTVHLENDPARTLTLARDLAFADRARSPHHRLMLPLGRYQLEAQDADYWYLRAPTPLHIDNRDIRGGIALGKIRTRSVPAAAFIDGQESGKILVWKLGADFLGREGDDWRRSF